MLDSTFAFTVIWESVIVYVNVAGTCLTKATVEYVTIYDPDESVITNRPFKVTVPLKPSSRIAVITGFVVNPIDWSFTVPRVYEVMVDLPDVYSPDRRGNVISYTSSVFVTDTAALLTSSFA